MSPDDAVDIEEGAQEEAVWRLAGALAGSVTSLQVALSMALEGAAAAGGSFANMAVLLPGSQQFRVVSHPTLSAGGPDPWEAHSLEDPLPACEAMRNGLPVLLATPEEVRRRYPELVAEMATLQLQALACTPLLTAKGQTLGAVGFGWRRPQAFGAAQLRRLDLLAQLAALAVERTVGQQLRERLSEHLPSVLESMPSAVISADPGFCVTYANPEAARLLRRPRAELSGINLFELFPEASGNQFESRCREATRSARAVMFEEHSPTLGCWLEIRAWSNRHGLNISLSNISERHAREVRRSNALQEAEHANARLGFLAGLSGELAAARTHGAVYAAAVRAVVPTMADWSTLVVPQGEKLERVAAKHRDPSLDPLARRLVGSYPHSFSGPSPGVVVYRSGEPLRLPRLAEHIIADLDGSIASAAYGRTLQLMGDGPGLIMPVRSGGDVLAVLTMVRLGAEFDEEDITVLTDAAGRIAAALDDATRLETQRATAAALQAAALPSSLPVSARLQLAAGYRAASEGSQVGGDWYDAFELPTGRSAVVVGDVAGHGLEAAAIMARMRNALRANLFAGFGPSHSLTRLSDLVAVEEPDTFATIVCAEIDLVTGDTTWASAGHPAPIHVSGDGDSTYLRGCPTPPIGWIHGEPTEPVEHSLILQPGDRLLMFTDGLIERRGADLDIGLTHLRILAEQRCLGMDAQAACETILYELLGTSHEDDVCLLVADFLAPEAAPGA